MESSAALRVLIVDDDTDHADSLAQLVRLWGYESAVAYNAQAALELAGTQRPHVVVLDLAMPGTSGLEVARQLRQRPELEATALFAITGFADDATRRRAYECGIEAFLVKPADPVELENLLALVAAQTLARTMPLTKRTKKMRTTQPLESPESAAPKDGA